MQIPEPELVRAVGHAYLLGVAASTVLLWLWLVAATTVLLRIYRSHRIGRSIHVIAAIYVLLGYVGYLFVLDPIAIRFMNSVAVVEPFVLHPWWVRVAIPSVSFIVWFFVLGFARRNTSVPEPAAEIFR